METSPPVNRLLLARVLFREAERFLGHVDPTLQSLALLPLQDAVELVLREVADHLPAKQEVAFEKTMESVSATLGRPLPLQGRMASLNKARVNLKHYGTPTDRDAVARFAPEALTFAREMVSEHLGIDFDSVSLADLIRHPTVRRQVKRAEEHLRGGQLDECAQACAVGFAYLTERLAEDPRWQFRSSHFQLRRGYNEESSALDALEEAMQKTREELDRHSHLFALLASGIGLENYWHFAAFTPHVSIMGDGVPHVGMVRGPLTPKQAQFCLDYLRDVALRSQESRGGVFFTNATALRAIRACDLLAKLPHDQDPGLDVVAQARPGEIFVHEGRPRLEQGTWLKVVQSSTGAYLWIDGGMLEVVTSPRQPSNTIDPE